MQKSNDGNVGFAAEGANSTIMHRHAAIRTALLQNIPAHRAELSANWIRHGPIGIYEHSCIHFVRAIGRTLRIRTEPARDGRAQTSARELARGWLCPLRRQRNAELLRQLSNDRIVEFRSIALLKHRQGGLLAPNLSRNNALRKPRRTASFLQFLTDLWIQIRHGRIL